MGLEASEARKAAAAGGSASPPLPVDIEGVVDRQVAEDTEPHPESRLMMDDDTAHRDNCLRQLGVPEQLAESAILAHGRPGITEHGPEPAGHVSDTSRALPKAKTNTATSRARSMLKSFRPNVVTIGWQTGGRDGPLRTLWDEALHMIGP